MKDLIAHYNIKHYFKLFINFQWYFFLKSNILKNFNIPIYRKILIQYNLKYMPIIFLFLIFILKGCSIFLKDKKKNYKKNLKKITLYFILIFIYILNLKLCQTLCYWIVSFQNKFKVIVSTTFIKCNLSLHKIITLFISFQYFENNLFCNLINN